MCCFFARLGQKKQCHCCFVFLVYVELLSRAWAIPCDINKSRIIMGYKIINETLKSEHFELDIQGQGTVSKGEIQYCYRFGRLSLHTTLSFSFTDDLSETQKNNEHFNIHVSSPTNITEFEDIQSLAVAQNDLVSRISEIKSNWGAFTQRMSGLVQAAKMKEKRLQESAISCSEQLKLSLTPVDKKMAKTIIAHVKKTGQVCTLSRVRCEPYRDPHKGAWIEQVVVRSQDMAGGRKKLVVNAVTMTVEEAMKFMCANLFLQPNPKISEVRIPYAA